MVLEGERRLVEEFNRNSGWRRPGWRDSRGRRRGVGRWIQVAGGERVGRWIQVPGDERVDCWIPEPGDVWVAVGSYSRRSLGCRRLPGAGGGMLEVGGVTWGWRGWQRPALTGAAAPRVDGGGAERGTSSGGSGPRREWWSREIGRASCRERVS